MFKFFVQIDMGYTVFPSAQNKYSKFNVKLLDCCILKTRRKFTSEFKTIVVQSPYESAKDERHSREIRCSSQPDYQMQVPA